MNTSLFQQLLTLLDKLEQSGIHYTLAHTREEALMVSVALPGERWEIEFLSDGTVEIERFISNGVIDNEDRLGELFARYADNTDLAEEAIYSDEDGVPV
ncbi:MAG: hypothetical protein U0350_38600 [Caldilineaceae bacterium]